MRVASRKASIAFHVRISIEADALRHELQTRLGLTAAQLVELALAALDRESERKVGR